jgi:hypothetical protein
MAERRLVVFCATCGGHLELPQIGDKLRHNPQDRLQRMVLWNPPLAIHITEQHVAPCIPTAHRTSPHISSRSVDHTPNLEPINRLFPQPVRFLKRVASITQGRLLHEEINLSPIHRTATVKIRAWQLRRSRPEKFVQENAWTSEHIHEIELLVACARTEVDTSSAERIRNLVRHPLNWQWIAGTAEDQGVFPHLYHSIRGNAPEAIPTASLTAWQRKFYGNAARNLYLTRTLSQLLDAFETNRIRVLPYKGPLLATAIYGNLGLRKAGDLDLLVHRRDFRKAKELLLSRGYQIHVALTWKDHLVHHIDGINIDLHQEIAPCWYNYRVTFDDLWDRRSTINLDRKDVATFSLEDLLIVLCLDIVRDTAEATDLRLFKFCDVARVVRSYNARNWELLLEKARQIGARGALLVALRATDDLIGISMPTDIRNMVFSSATVDMIARHAVAMVRDGPPTQKRFPHQTRIIVKVRDRPKDKLLVMLLAIGHTFSRKPRTYGLN